MNDSKKNDNRKIGSLVAKSLIILAVLVAVLSFSIFSWFTTGQTAYGSGINIKSKADGVEISWDGETYYKHLTAMDSNDVVEGQVGLSKNLSEEDGVPASLGLVTGNGLNFFTPVVNRRTGDILLNTDGTWKGSVVEDGTGKYIDADLYFRAQSPFEIYLAGDSRVSPKDPEGNMSDYGSFSKDNIAAASRVAFIQQSAGENGTVTESCSFIWAPNANIELIESKDGYKKLTETKETVETGGAGGVPAEIMCQNTKKNYYFWLPNAYRTDDQTQMDGLYSQAMHFEEYENRNGVPYGLFVCDYEIKFLRQNSTIPFVINENSSTWSQSDINTYLTVSNMNNVTHYIDGNDEESPILKFSYQTYNVNHPNGQTYQTFAFYLSDFKDEATVTVKLGYNPTEKKFIILGYSGEGNQGNNKVYDRTEKGTTEVSYYVIPENVTLALASEGMKYAVSSNTALQKSVSFKEAGVISSKSISNMEQFTVKKTGDKADATYAFINSKTGTYLKADKNGIAYVGELNATPFKLISVEGIDGPVLQSNDGLCLAYANGKFKLVAESSVTNTNFVTVYQGTSYELIDNSSASQSYTYYKSGDKGVTTLSGTTTPKLFASKSTDTESTNIGTVPVVTLTKANDTDEYYTAHIIVRIWVEGTDRDALQPLADGLFNVDLHFVPKK